jgi:hypothetical protein
VKNSSKPYEQQKQTKTAFMKKLRVGKCLLSFGVEYLIFQFAVENRRIKIHRTRVLPVVFMGVKLGLSK